MPNATPFTLSLVGALIVSAAAIVVVSCSMAPTSVVATGERIYRQKCTDCHGAQGQGVEGKYKEALAGDWALPKLARYIAKNMPDDNPSTLAAGEAEAVAAYVFDAFYSRAAQAKLHPARIEIAHLTNRQYAVTVADILRRFWPSPTETATALASDNPRGLSATYYGIGQRGRFDAAKVTHSVRTGCIRLAPHFYNTMDELDTALSLLG